MGLDMHIVSYEFKEDYKGITGEVFNELLHFVDKKVFIVGQIKTDQLVNSDKTPYTDDLKELKEEYQEFAEEHSIPLTFDDLEDYQDHIVKDRELISYWRKANQIHEFFRIYVKGEFEPDETTDYYEVNRTALNILKEYCEKVLESKTEEVSKEYLPTSEGFFFGNLDYDDYYYKTIKNTLELEIPKCIQELDNKKRLFYYSWY